MKQPTPKPIRERAWVCEWDGTYVRRYGSLVLILSASKMEAEMVVGGGVKARGVEVEIRSVPRKVRKRARKA